MDEDKSTSLESKLTRALLGEGVRTRHVTHLQSIPVSMVDPGLLKIEMRTSRRDETESVVGLIRTQGQTTRMGSERSIALRSEDRARPLTIK